MTIRIGVQLQPQHGTWSAIHRAVAEAEAMGVDVIYNWDHFFPLDGDPHGPHFEAWTMLAAWAEQTSRVEIGCLVTCNSYRNADLLADMARTVDHISGGRLILGIGAGWFERDYDEYGYEFGTAGTRLADLAQALPRIEQRWSMVNPAPVRPIPILIGGSGERKTLRMVARHAHAWHAFHRVSDPDRYAHKARVLSERCAEIGRDPAEIRRTVGIPADAISHADGLIALDVDEFTIGVSGPDYDLSVLEPWLALREVGR